MKEPFNSQAPHFLTKVNAYCAKVLPLVFDNSLSYYEFLCKVCHKLNETIDALNAQNLNIIEFTHMVQLEIEKFEKYIDDRITEFEDEIKRQWEEYKEEMNKAFEEFKAAMREEWEQEKALNEKFRQDLLADITAFKAEITAQQQRFENQIKADFQTYKDTVNAEIEQFEHTTNADLSAFKNTMQIQQNEFEKHMIDLFTDFTTDESKARTDFENNFQQLFEQWKVDTLNALQQQLQGYETNTTETLINIIDTKIQTYINGVLNRISDTDRKLQQEIDTRQNQINDLQSQINQLTPEGAIKADTADENGNSQLYTNNPDTGERTNIFPIVNGSGNAPIGTNEVFAADTPDSHGTTYLYVNTDGGNKRIIYPKTGGIEPILLNIDSNDANCNLKLVSFGMGQVTYHLGGKTGNAVIATKGVTDLGSVVIRVLKKDIRQTFNDDPISTFNNLYISYRFYVDDDYNDLLINCSPQIVFYWAQFQGDYFTVGAKLKMNDPSSPGQLALPKSVLTINVSQFINVTS